MALSRGARIEAAINRRIVHRRWRKGWRPRVVPFTGYGSRKFVRVLARVVLVDPDAEELDESADDALSEAQRGWRLFM
ncbi:MAG: ABC transporter ATP-binding protein, partial [Actinomycetes bacterium]|nr:ABC transporter ATP-binding protein [Actinomycetes bacterium]